MTILNELLPVINEIGAICNNALITILKIRNNIEINKIDVKYLKNLEKLLGRR